MFNITTHAEEEKVVLEVEGRLDTNTAPELEEEVVKVVEGKKELVFDFEKLEYISSAGLRVLLAAHKIMSKQGEMKVVKVSSEIMEIFEVTGFSEILTIE